MNRRHALAVMLGLAGLLPFCSFGAPFPVFKIMTEQWNPYNYQENGEAKGLAVDVLVRMLERVGSSQGRGDIHFFPWERGYQSAQQMSDVLLFSMTRTPEREARFKWVGPIADNTIYLFALKSRHIAIAAPAELKKYRIDTYIGAASEDVLVKEFGLRLEDLDRSERQVSTVQKIQLGRGDLFPASYPTLDRMCVELHCQREVFEPVFPLSRAQLYYAFSKDTPDAVVTQLQSAFDTLKAEGVLGQIGRQYRQ